jgi:hypothetical protein
VIGSVPLGAPVRVNLRLTNVSNVPLQAPSSLSLGSGLVKGQVTDPSGVVRTFSPLVICLDKVPLRILELETSITDSLTLLRGGQGALFPAAGLYHMYVEAHWDADGAEMPVTGGGKYRRISSSG